MGLFDFLRSARPPAPPATWRIERRPFGADAFLPVEALGTAAAAGARVLALGARFEPWDLVRVAGPDGRTARLWVHSTRGLLDAGPVPDELGPRGSDWLSAWEGHDAAGPAMLRAARGVDGPRLAQAAWHLASKAPGLTAAGDHALVLAGRWIDGAAVPREELLAAAVAALGATAWADRAAGDVALVAAAGPGDDATGHAALAGFDAARAVTAGDPDAARHQAVWRSQAPVVRRFIPLAFALLGRAGHPQPAL